jgi:hypothetical protein
MPAVRELRTPVLVPETTSAVFAFQRLDIVEKLARQAWIIRKVRMRPDGKSSSHITNPVMIR